jgi:chromodomain-helicase-DNA-binding protein 7
VPATLTRKDDRLVLDLSTTRGSEFNDALNKARDIPGKQFDWDTKLWSFPDEPMVADRILRTIQPIAEQDLLEWIRGARTRGAEEVTTPIPDDSEVLIPWGARRMPWQPEKVNDLAFKGLFDYQRSAVAHLARVKRAILADDMGLGKTIQAISAVEEFRLRNVHQDGTLPDGPKLIVSPKSVLGAWQRELHRWLEPGTFGIQVLDASNPEKRHQQLAQAIRDDLWIITNWEALRVKHEQIVIKSRQGATRREKRLTLKEPLFIVPWGAHLDLTLAEMDVRTVDRLKNAKDKVKAGKWLACVADEIHRAKNPRAKQTKGLHRIDAEFMLGLTGTPVMNSPDELWSLLHWLWPTQYTNHDRFFNQFVDYYEESYGSHKGKVITGVKNPEALRFELRGRVVRRTAGSVRSLPGHRRIYFPIELLPKQKSAYKDAETKMWVEIEKAIAAGDNTAAQLGNALMTGNTSTLTSIPNGGARVVRLLQIIENLALLGGDDVSATMDEFEDRFEDGGGAGAEPWVVYCAFRESCEILARRLRTKHGATVAVYTGEQSGVERTRIEDRFQRGEIDVIVGTTGALKEGITLTRSNRGYFLTRSWVPATDEQAEARYANRVGQSRKSTTYIPQAIGTVVTSKVEPTNRLKEKIVKAVHSKDKIEEVHKS